MAKLKISTDAQLTTMRVEVEQTRLKFSLELDEKASIIAKHTITEISLRAEIEEYLEKIKVLEEDRVRLEESYSSLKTILDETSAVLQVTSSLF